MSEFAALAERIIEELLAADPALATSAGDHRYDDRLPDLSTDGVAGRVGLLRDASVALSGVDTDDLEPADRVDHEQLLSLVERSLFALTEVREYEWNPLAHNPGMMLHAVLARPFAPAEQRAELVAGRLAAIPDALATARATLVDCPRIHLETAAGQFRGTASLIGTELPGLLEQAPAMKSTVEPVAAAAVAALESFASGRRPRPPGRTRAATPGWGGGCGRPSSGTPSTPS